MLSGEEAAPVDPLQHDTLTPDDLQAEWHLTAPETVPANEGQ